MTKENQEAESAAPKVVSMSGVAITHNEKNVNLHCVEAIEDFLQRAKDGEVVGVIIVGQCRDGSTCDGSAGFQRPTRMAGHLMAMVHELFMPAKKDDADE